MLSEGEVKRINRKTNLAISSANLTAVGAVRAPFLFKYKRRSPCILQTDKQNRIYLVPVDFKENSSKGKLTAQIVRTTSSVQLCCRSRLNKMSADMESIKSKMIISQRQQCMYHLKIMILLLNQIDFLELRIL